MGFKRQGQFDQGLLQVLQIHLQRARIRRDELNNLKTLAERINTKRNAIVHRGFFAEEPETIEIIGIARRVIEGLVLPHEPMFRLPKKKAPKIPSSPGAAVAIAGGGTKGIS